MRGKKSSIGKSVFNRTTGLMGEIVASDGVTVTVECNGVVKAYLRNSFKSMFRVIESEEDSVGTDKKVDGRKNPRPNPKGEPDVGQEILSKFLANLKNMANQNLDISFKRDGKYMIVLYNGYRIFEVAIANRRISVFAHPRSLSPLNASLANRIFPKEGGRHLRAKFVFTSPDEVPLMKSLITDGLYYRQIEER